MTNIFRCLRVFPAACRPYKFFSRSGKLLASILFLLVIPLAPAQETGDGEPSADINAESNGIEDGEEDWSILMEGAGITVEGQKPQPAPVSPESDNYGAQHNVVSAEQIREQGSLDVLDALRDVPGVTFSKRNIAGTNTGTSVYVRGRGYTHPSLDTTVSFDGVPRFGLIYGQSMVDSIPVFSADSIEIYKYPQPSSFGAGYANINVSPRYMAEQGWEAEAGFSGGSFLTVGEDASFGLRKGRFDIFAAQSLVSTQGHVVHSGAYQQSYYLNLGLWINAYWNLRLLGNFVDAETLQPPRTAQSKSDILSTYKTGTFFSTATLNNEYDNAAGHIKLYYNFTDFRWLDDDVRNAGDWSRQDLNAWGLRAKEVFSFWKGSDITAGIDLDMNKTANEDHNTVSPSVITGFPLMTLVSPYLAISQFFSLGEKFYVIPSGGLRAFIHTVWDNSLSPQAGLVFGYDSLEFNVNYARGIIYPAPANIQGLVNSGAVDTAALKQARPETVHHIEGGVSYKWRSFAAVNASYFYDDGRDRIVASGPDIPGNVSSVSYFRIQGAELGGSVSFTPDKLFLKRLEFFTGGTWITNISAKGEDGREVTRMPYTPVFSMSVGFKWTLLHNFRLSGDYQMLSGLYGGNLQNTASFTELTESARLDDIHLLNLRLGYSLQYRPWHIEDGEIFVSLNNALNRKYEYYAGYVMPGITFTLGGRIKFK
jgi:iron complex outermembrane receptor protein